MTRDVKTPRDSVNEATVDISAAIDHARERMSVVIAGHVDHGKSTVIGRLMADTGSLPQGKLDQVREQCRRNARPFEYAFLLDALKDEQAQGITIDAARCFFKTARRDYIIIDAPGHVEFLKNMVTGAARAEAALLVIDAAEGIQENTRRHGYLLSMLGISQLVVLVNKMDLVQYNMEVFEDIRRTYTEFLDRLNVHPVGFVPLCAREGENIVQRAAWYDGPTVLDYVESFARREDLSTGIFRMPVQGVYKFTEQGDDRRIIAGTVESGAVAVGDRVVFYPSRKASTITSIEAFNRPPQERVVAGRAEGFTLATELYVRPGELMTRDGQPAPVVATRFRANLFWMGRSPMIPGKRYKLKLAAARAHAYLAGILNVLDASELTTTANKKQIDRHDVAECVLETLKPVAFDLSSELEGTGRFVIVDNYEIAGGGIVIGEAPAQTSVLGNHVRQRELMWDRSDIAPQARRDRFGHGSKFIVITGGTEDRGRAIAKAIERRLFEENFRACYLGASNIEYGLDVDVMDAAERRTEGVRRLGELARIITDSGQIFIVAAHDLDSYDLEILKILNAPHEILVVADGVASFGPLDSVLPMSEREPEADVVERIFAHLRRIEIIPDYSI